jgi:hypothetical protein
MDQMEHRMLPLAFRVVRVSVVIVTCVILFALIQGAYRSDFWSRMSLDRIPALVAIFGTVGVACAALLLWDMKREARKWSVKITNDEVQVADHAGAKTHVPVSDLRLVIAATGFSLWRNDVSLALFDEGDDALVSFPLLAAGADSFLAWLSRRPGYQHGELAKAQASARGGGYVIWSEP